MTDPRPGDAARARVESFGIACGQRIATLRMRHAEFRPDRFWSFCDVSVAVPDVSTPAVAGVDVLKVGDEVSFVLGARAEASRTADAMGHYSFRLHAASGAPEIPIERSTERIYAGLIERTEPPAGGELVLHLGSGATCYVELAGDGPFPQESIEHGSWCEFIFEEPFRPVTIRRTK